MRGQDTYPASVTDHCGPNTTIKDFGPDILNLIPNPRNDDPWEDEDGPLFPELDDEIAHAKAAGDYIINLEVLLIVEDLHELARVLH